ncbi:MAG: elongation factor G [Methylicorpusculum sp.]|uniref:elongation factor G n=1 Tax=Methylicorpusculum sp. TaxID=2713644 RepID=UPI00272713C2|nr:elongation factor G [Methylicorpusculum sp.]MDO8938611.1 elongation factor G [Methylicorpusculum sp.]MDO9239952.1 elongation factor G [Methylicorpusculum sp.]MDP2203630.1 elongation factor G [Methylicorpusculum sp.]
MPHYTTKAIRTIALVGHGAAGKTSLAEALLHGAGAIKNKGMVEKGNTVCDFDSQEKSIGHSLQSAIVHFEHENALVHLLDTPGYPDFAGQAIAALEAVETVLVVVNAQTGIELMTERMLRWARERKLCTMIVINKIDADNLDLPGLVADIRTRFNGLVLDLPAHGAKEVVEVLAHDSGMADFGSVAEAHNELIERIVEEDMALLEKYLEEGVEPKPSEIHSPFESALRAGFAPILFTSVRTGAGIKELLHVIANLAPNPTEGNLPPFYKVQPDGSMETFQAEPDPDKHVLAHVFKVVSDPYMGKVGIFRMHQGTLKQDAQLFVGDAKRPFKAAHLYQLQGKDFQEVDALIPGDIGAVVKVDEIMFDAVLHDSHDEDYIHLKPMRFPPSMTGLSVETKRKGDEQRLFDILDKLALEDPTFIIERRPATNETVIMGLGDAHLKAKLEKMVSQYKLEVDIKPPLIPYRETISQPAEGHCRHKKQTGGAGQFGEVFLRIEPLARGEGIEFVDAVKGGTIPGAFMPAVEKGVRQALDFGVVAGFPVIDLRVTVYDGKTHAVDSKEIAFVTAGHKAVIEAIRAAKPLVLEPVVDIEIIAPETAMGDITGDLSAKRGHITGTDSHSPGRMLISGKVPLSELTDYQSRLNALTSGRGHYAIELSHYAPLPGPLQQQLTSGFKLKEEDQ